MAVDWKQLNASTQEQLVAEGLNQDCLPIANPRSERPGEPLTKAIVEQMFTPSDEYLARAAENEKED